MDLTPADRVILQQWTESGPAVLEVEHFHSISVADADLRSMEDRGLIKRAMLKTRHGTSLLGYMLTLSGHATQPWTAAVDRAE